MNLDENEAKNRTLVFFRSIKDIDAVLDSDPDELVFKERFIDMKKDNLGKKNFDLECKCLLNELAEKIKCKLPEENIELFTVKKKCNHWILTLK